jgi:hypothetical protein
MDPEGVVAVYDRALFLPLLFVRQSHQRGLGTLSSLYKYS